MYHVDDPINFMTTFYGCLIAGIIPVPIEPPASKDVSLYLFCNIQCTIILPFICCALWLLIKGDCHTSLLISCFSELALNVFYHQAFSQDLKSGLPSI